ncbi:splicing factor 1-like isoform X1 [Clavelina lepadiformis]|uniref:splicing factor 1-like isoform X1 n=1 Tax=Clavelina lepadiformis TaxID=159417 RepID=UPI004042AE5E
MSRRQGSSFTGANAIPLGARNKAIGAKRSFTSSPPRDEPPRKSAAGNDSVSSNAALALKAAQAAAANLAKLAHLTKKAEDDQANCWPSANPSQSFGAPAPIPQQTAIGGSGGSTNHERGRQRKKKSRWGNVTLKTEIPGMPATIPTHLTPEQQKAYIVQLQIEDISRKLKSGDLGIPPNPEDRSPSPEPIYNGEGKRMNTREYRTRKTLEEERHKLIQKMLELNTDYKPPMDYKPMMQRISERVMIPQDGNPNINFVGLLIGPRGNTLKKIEKESNCKIMIRGKGSVKEGKIGRKDGQPLPGEDEPLHALVSSTSIENVQKAVAEINQIIKSGIEQPEEENDLRKLQLMELAKLNGTLREDLMPKERAWLKPENQNITNTTVCTKCGGRGHLAQDCVASAPSSSFQQQGGTGGNVDRAKMDSEYMSLMAELGEGPPSGNGGSDGNQGPNQSGTGKGGFNSGPPNRFGGPRPPWSGPRGPSRFGGPQNQRPRFGGRGNGGGYNSRSGMMNQGGPPPPWMQAGPYGGPPGPNQWGPPGNMGPPPFGGFPNMPPGDGMGGDGSMPPWMQGQDGSNMMGSMYGDQSGGNYFNQPPPPPPSSAPQPPPPPSSGTTNNQAPWSQQQWGSGDGTSAVDKDGDGVSGSSTTGSSSYTDAGSYYSNAQGGMSMDNSMGGMGMGGYGNMGMWGMGAPGPVPPPMPTGPGPVPPPPPGGQGSGDNSQGNVGDMGYSSMGMMQNYGMPPAPPPPPPQ